MSSADFFSKSTFLKYSFKNTIEMSNSLDPDQARHFVRPDLGPLTVCKGYPLKTIKLTSQHSMFGHFNGVSLAGDDDDFTVILSA